MKWEGKGEPEDEEIEIKVDGGDSVTLTASLNFSVKL